MLLWGMSKVADLQEFQRTVDTRQHYKFKYKHVTEVSQDRRNCLTEPKCLEYNACLPGTDSSGMVVHQIRTEQNPVQ